MSANHEERHWNFKSVVVLALLGLSMAWLVPPGLAQGEFPQAYLWHQVTPSVV